MDSSDGSNPNLFRLRSMYRRLFVFLSISETCFSHFKSSWSQTPRILANLTKFSGTLSILRLGVGKGENKWGPGAVWLPDIVKWPLVQFQFEMLTSIPGSHFFTHFTKMAPGCQPLIFTLDLHYHNLFEFMHNEVAGNTREFPL